MQAQEASQTREVATRLTLPETARRLGVSNDTVRRYIKTGRLPAVLFAGKYRIRADDADALLDAA